MSGHSSRWTQIQKPSRRTLHHTWPLTPCSVALETCFLWKWGGQGWGDGENPWVSRRGVWGEVYVFSIPGQSHDWLSPMNREFGGHECLRCIPPPSSLIPHCLFSVSCPLRPFYTSLFSSSLFCLWLRCQTDGSQHKHLLEVRKASITTLINKPKGSRFCKYNMFLWVQMCTSIVHLYNALDSLMELNLALFKIPEENGYMHTIISSIPELSLILVFLAIILIDYVAYSQV